MTVTKTERTGALPGEKEIHNEQAEEGSDARGGAGRALSACGDSSQGPGALDDHRDSGGVIVKRAVVYTDRSALAAYNANVAQTKADLAAAKAAYEALGDSGEHTAAWIAARSDYKMLQQEYGTIVGTCGCKFKPVDAQCRGDSPSKDAFHFYVFSCQAFFDRLGTARGIVRVVSRNRAVWTRVSWVPAQ